LIIAIAYHTLSLYTHSTVMDCIFITPRILQLYAEENAIDDTIYYLGEALRKGVIELDVFLKVILCLHAMKGLHNRQVTAYSD